MSPQIARQVEHLQTQQRALDTITGWLSHTLEEPEKPRCDIAQTAEELKQLMLEQMRKEAERTALAARLASLPLPSPLTDAALVALEAQHAAHALWLERVSRHKEDAGEADSMNNIQ